MEKVEGAFTPLDRIGQLTIRNLDIIDASEKLAIRSQVGLLSAESETVIPQPGNAKKSEICSPPSNDGRG